MGLFPKRTVVADEDNEQLAAELDVVVTLLGHYSPGSSLTFGVPSRCPLCGNFGFVDSVNHQTGSCFNHCFGCGTNWLITQRALRAYAELRTRSAPVESSNNQSTVPTESLVMLDAERPSPAPRYVAPLPVAPVAPVLRTASTTPKRNDALDAAPTAIAPDEPIVAVSAQAHEPADVVEVVEPVSSGPRPLRMLVIEDNPFDYAILECLFDEADPGLLDVTQAMTFAEGRDLSLESQFDVILLDLNLPDSTGVSTILEWQHSVDSRTPVIAMSGSTDSDLVGAARATGVAHFVQKGQIEDLSELGTAGADRFVKLLRTTIKKAAATSARPVN